MDQHDYFRILDLPENASADDIKRAYRIKARLFHPDINKAEGAEEMFIRVTEAYDFLISNMHRLKSDEDAYREAMENWIRYRKQKSQYRAAAYARTPYARFRKTKLYKTTKIFDGATIIFSFAISIMVLFYTIFGYIYRLQHPVPGLDHPSVSGFILLLLLGLVFLVISIIYLIAWQQTLHKLKKDSKNMA